MKLAFFSLRDDPCGGSRLMIDLANSLTDRGHGVVLGLPFHFLHRAPWMPCTAERVDAMDVPAMGRFDAVLFAHPDGYLPAYPLTPLVRACTTDRRLLLLRSFLPVHAAAAQNEDIELVATSPWLFERASQFCKRVHRAYGGVNLTRFCSAKARDEHDRPQVLYSDSRDARKGSAIVREALEIAAERGAKFDILRLGGQEWDVREQYRRADVFVSGELKWGGGWCSAVAEAMASGCAVACTDVPSVSPLAKGEATALTAPPDDPDALADAICRLVNDAELRGRLAQGAKRQVAEFSILKMAEELERLIAGMKKTR